MNYGSFGRELLLELKRTDPKSSTSSSSGSNDGINSIPPYNDRLVSSTLQDLKLHVQALNEQVEAASASAASIGNNNSQQQTNRKASMEVRPSLLLQEAAIQRNKRCLLAYHFIRMQRIQQIHYWQTAESVSTATLSNASDGIVGNNNNRNKHTTAAPIIKNLSPAENEFLDTYKHIVSKYVTNVLSPPNNFAMNTGIVDLRSCAVVPPLTMDRVVVRVIDETPFHPGPVVLESGQTVSLVAGGTYYLQYNDCETYIRAGSLRLLDTEEQDG